MHYHISLIYERIGIIPKVKKRHDILWQSHSIIADVTIMQTAIKQQITFHGLFNNKFEKRKTEYEYSPNNDLDSSFLTELLLI